MRYKRDCHASCIIGTTLFVFGASKASFDYSIPLIERLTDAHSKVGINSGSWEILQIFQKYEATNYAVNPLTIPVSDHEILILRENSAALLRYSIESLSIFTYPRSSNDSG